MTREEAIKLVKRIKGAMVYTEEEKEALETLIPELQSEDEKIRKLVVNRVRTATEMTESLRELLLTYLEKQKHSLNFDVISSWLRDHASRYVNSEYNEFHHCTEYDGTINVERLIADLKVAVDSGTFDIQEQKEQKPWEWGEEETKLLDSIIDDYEKASKSFCGYDGKIGLLRAIRDGEYNLPKQEWGEEDERMLSRCIKSVECSKQFADSETYKVAKDVEMNWLKSLPERFNLEPKQERNEEDERMKSSVIWHLRNSVNNGDIEHSAGQLENWVESLRPSWRPSEEQMRALKMAVDEHWDVDGDALYSLYIELKELYDTRRSN